MENNEVDLIQQNEEKHNEEKIKLTEKAKKFFKKHKEKFKLGGVAVLLVVTNTISAKVNRDKGHEDGYEEGLIDGENKGIASVMNDPSKLGRGLRDCRDKQESWYYNGRDIL